jgi:hypothetical protein
VPQKIHNGAAWHKSLESVLSSELFSKSDSLRRLLRYLAEKSIAGEADQLKEFTVGVEALGKPDDYNPQIDPSVRVKVGRLRRKLEEYYQTEGKNEPTRIALPKRHFKIVFEKLQQPVLDSSPTVPDVTGRLKLWQGIGTTAILAALILAVLALQRNPGTAPVALPVGDALSDEQRVFWAPYLEGSRPTLICIGTPMFIWLDGETGTFIRDPLVNSWPLVEGKDKVAAIQSELGSASSHPVYTYAGSSAAMGTFLIGKQLAHAGLDPILVRSNHFDWGEARRSNVIYFGSPKDSDHLRDFRSSFRVVKNGMENINPQPGEQKLYVVERLPNGRPAVTYAAVGRFPAKDELGYVTALIGWDGHATWGAAEYLVRPESMKELDQILRGTTNEYPESFEVLLRVECEQDFPMNITYLAHRVH